MFSSPSHPQSNGKLERFHSTLGVALRSYAAGNKTNWHKLFPTIAHGFNTTAVTPTGFSPYMVVTGTNPRTLADCLLQPEDGLPTDIREYVTDITQRVQIIRDIARRNMQDTHEQAKLKHDRQGTATPTFTPGDIVYLHREQYKKNECAKLTDRFDGPMLILHCGPNFTYKLRNMQTGKDLKYMVNACRLRLYKDGRDLLYTRMGAQCDPNVPVDQNKIGSNPHADITADSTGLNTPTPALALNSPANVHPQRTAVTDTATRYADSIKLTNQEKRRLGINPREGGAWYHIKRVLKDKKDGITRRYLVIWQHDNSRSWVKEQDMAPKSLRDYLILKDERKHRRRRKRLKNKTG
jgi:hypothetical protein